MVTSQSTIDLIRKIIEKHYARLVISVLGGAEMSKEELKKLRDMGVDPSNRDSFLTEVYLHNFLNSPPTKESPRTSNAMKQQQKDEKLKPVGEAHDYSIENLNENIKQQINKLKTDVGSRIEGIIRENNEKYKFQALGNLTRDNFMDIIEKESSISKVKQKLKATSKQANRDWTRVAVTEISNAIGIGSVDRIVTDNKNSDLNEVYVFRIPVRDSKTCKYCRRFYLDSDGSPRLYRLSTLLAYGSNYGKKQDEWNPVIGATHPNTRTSAIIELKPGWKLTSSGDVTFIGLDKWHNYIVNKLSE
jgi:hypothetical protein